MAQAVLTWTPAGGSNSLNQEVQYKKNSAATWTVASTVDFDVSTYTITGLLDNTLYDFRVVNNCIYGGPVPTSLDSAIKFVCPTVTITKTYNQVAFSFTAQGADITKYKIELLNNAGTTVLSSVDKPSPSGTVSGTFTSLAPSTSYKLRVTMYSGDSFSNQCALQTVTTDAAPVCNAPSNVTATMS